MPASAGDPERGKKEFLKCVMCHSADAGVHKTGPSLAGIVGRRAGTVPGFGRYSDAMKNADVVWTDEALDDWLRDPPGFIPGNRMTMRGLAEKRTRADIIAYLKRLGAGEAQPAAPRETARPMEGMGESKMANLKETGADRDVKAIRYCGDTYHVTVASGETIPFWEFNLRFKTDSSANGPPPGRAALLPASMMGDRAFVVFASPKDIGAFIETRC